MAVVNNQGEAMVNEPLLQHCLQPLLKALEWHGTGRKYYESLPHFSLIQTVEEFCWTMQNLGYENHPIRMTVHELDSRLLPCLFVPTDGSAPKVLLEKTQNSMTWFDAKLDQVETTQSLDIKGIVYIFKPVEKDVLLEEDPAHWFKNALAPRKKSLYYVGLLTFLQSLLMLATPVFIMKVYDKVVGTGSISMLVAFAIGVGMALLSLAVLMIIRFRILAYVGVYIQRHIGNAIFQHLLRLPAIYTEASTVGTQITRLHDFNSVREFFSSPLFGTLIEVPFMLIYLVAVWLVGGVLVLVPIITIFMAFLITFILWKLSRKNITRSSAAQAHRQEFLVETLQRMRSLQYAGLQNKWQQRFREMNSLSSLYGQKLYFMNSASDGLFDMLNIFAGLATLMLGALLVINDQLQVGALIGTMFIIWRILSPVKTINVAMPKIIQLRRSIQQINALMGIPLEGAMTKGYKNAPLRLQGAITFSQVAFRYPGASSSALVGIDFSIKPGQVFVLLGPSAAGKSTIVKLILALYSAQMGRVMIDGRDIQQYTIERLRNNMAYVPQETELFYGTVAQNLRLAEPAATMEELVEAAKRANFLEDVEALPHGFDTRIRDYGDKKLGASFTQKLSLTRAYLKNVPILIMDEPATALDNESDEMLANVIKQAKGKQTVILISHRPSHIKLADVALVIDDGKQVILGKPEEVLEKIPKELI